MVALLVFTLAAISLAVVVTVGVLNGQVPRQPPRARPASICGSLSARKCARFAPHRRASQSGDNETGPPLFGGDPLPFATAEAWNISNRDWSRTETFVFSSGTWIGVDVSPDGSHIVFDVAGGLYELNIGAGESRRSRLPWLRRDSHPTPPHPGHQAG